ncbi:Uncharacterized protein FWK35_00035516, partial [Aphis craccivora]
MFQLTMIKPFAQRRNETVLCLRVLISTCRCFWFVIRLRVYSSVKMPKIKPRKSALLKNYVSEFGDTIFSSDGSILFCKMCEVQ